MVRNPGHSGLRQELRDRHPEGKVHRDRQDILRDQHVDAEPLHEPPQHGGKVSRHIADPLRHDRRALVPGPDALVDPLVFGMSEKGLGNAHRHLRGTVAAAAEPEDLVAHLLEDLRPFQALQRHAIGAGEAGRNKAYSHRSNGNEGKRGALCGSLSQAQCQI